MFFSIILPILTVFFTFFLFSSPTKAYFLPFRRFIRPHFSYFSGQYLGEPLRATSSPSRRAIRSITFALAISWLRASVVPLLSLSLKNMKSGI
jgi:hypothetical protein